MNWLSIDPATRMTGVARWRGTDLIQTLDISPCKAGWQTRSSKRRLATYKTLEALLSRICGGVSYVVMEGVHVGRNVQSALTNARFGGRIEGVARLCGVEVVEVVEPSEWRASIAAAITFDEGYGDASFARWPTHSEFAKARAYEDVARRIEAGTLSGIAALGTQDEVDAVCVGLSRLDEWETCAEHSS